jgi:hypothetical protein
MRVDLKKEAQIEVHPLTQGPKSKPLEGTFSYNIYSLVKSNSLQSNSLQSNSLHLEIAVFMD